MRGLEGGRDEGLVPFFVRSLRRLMDEYEGQYVAIVGGTVVAHGKDAEGVFESARRMHPEERILIGQVPVRV
jgi:hypothetical protein